MCVRRYEDNWGELKGKLMEKDVLEVLSLSAFCRDEQDLEEKLRYCGEKDIRLQVKDARISPDVRRHSGIFHCAGDRNVLSSWWHRTI